MEPSHDSTNLSCSSFEERIHQLLDDRLTLTGDAKLMDHAAQCTPCHELLSEYDSVEDSIKLLHADIEDAIALRLAEKDQSKRFEYRLGWWISIAAALLIMVGMIPHSGTDSGSFQSPRARKAAPPSGSMLAIHRSSPIPELSRQKKVAKPTSPFHKDFDFVGHFPMVPNWNTVSSQFNSIEPVMTYSAEIPGVRTATSSLNITIDLIRQSLSKQPKQDADPDLGFLPNDMLFVSI